MPAMTIDGATVPFTPGQTILQAATGAGIAIPSLCALDGIEPPVSCFVCVVRIGGRKGVVPSCATMAEEGMVVESESGDVRGFRRKALELLLSEHAGDCEAPCMRICPAGLDIPVMAGAIVAGDIGHAARTVWGRLALPGVLGHICTAPCEKGCRRAPVDGAVSIRDLHRQVSDAVFSSDTKVLPRGAESSARRIAIVGAGPAGLSAAYYLALHGHACVIIDNRELPGGMLRYGVDRSALPMEVLEREIGVIGDMGVVFQTGDAISDPRAFDELAEGYDAVILATGTLDAPGTASFGVTSSSKGIEIAAGTFATSRAGVFACGGAVSPGRMAVRAVGQGRLAAESVHRFLAAGATALVPRRPFDSHLGRLGTGEIDQFAATDLRIVLVDRSETSAFFETTVTAAARCFQCDCGKKERCGLRMYAQEYGISQDQYRTGARKQVVRTRYGGGLMHEPGKCIDCGRCVGITKADRVRPGLSLVNRGFNVEVCAPFGAGMEEAMGSSRDRCIAACPTGALWNWKLRDDGR